MKTTRLTTAQALVRHLAALRIEAEDDDDGHRGAAPLLPYCAGVWSIFGHGNVAGLGEALWAQRAELPTYRAHNEQGMAHAAIAFAKANFRRRIMAVTTSIGPGATNLVTAAALAHVNRLPVLLLPGDVFASRAPDPVLQQVEDFQHGDVSANDCLRPVSRYFDRLLRPEQLLSALPRALQVMTDPALCGPACLALPQDVQAEAFDCPDDFLHPPPLRVRRPEPDAAELQRAVAALRASRRPLIVAGGGVLYSRAAPALADFAARAGIPVAETQAGKSSLAWDHALNLGAIGVTGSPAANELAREADLVLCIGTRLQDFTTGSHTLFPAARLIGLNVQPLDAAKWAGQPLVCDARRGLAALGAALAGWRADAGWTARAAAAARDWNARVTELTAAVARATATATADATAAAATAAAGPAGSVGPVGPAAAPATATATAAPDGRETGPTAGDPGETGARRAPALPYDADVIGAVRDSAADSPRNDIAVCAAGTLPAELHKLWRAGLPGNYHVEYGYSCMGYEIAGGLGVKLARPECEVIVLVGDGSYLMLNSEIATSVMLGLKLVVVVLDNRGYGCIQRLQLASGSAGFNNLLADCAGEAGHDVRIDFAAHARSLGATAVHVADLRELESALRQARAAAATQVIVIDTTHERTTDDGGCWWEVAMPQVSPRAEIDAAAARHLDGKRLQRL